MQGFLNQEKNWLLVEKSNKASRSEKRTPLLAREGKELLCASEPKLLEQFLTFPCMRTEDETT
jgi:hypothetical protein